MHIPPCEQLELSNTITYRPADTSFVMVTNRPFQIQNPCLGGDACDTSKVTYLFIVQRGKKRLIRPFNQLEELLQCLPRNNWVLYTEGMGKTFSGNIERGLLMQQMYHVNVLMFDYASIHPHLNIWKNYQFSVNNSANSYRQYEALLLEIARLQQSTSLFSKLRLSLFFHSMGNIMFRQLMLHRKGNRQGLPVVNNLILNAACIPQQQHPLWLSTVKFAERIYVNYNPSDKKLKGAWFMSLNRKLGCKPKPPKSSNVNYINFKPAVAQTHNYFLNIPERSFRLSSELYQYFSIVLNGHAFPLSKLNAHSRGGYYFADQKK
ncbi:MAG TPA: hypothetical protein PLU10_00645 [Chitinophagaceae bacterium]|nr:hypothetical protein [Chitinophagaceae bacterium]